MAMEPKREQPVRLPNPNAQPFVTALKTVRFFAVVFFWVVLAAVGAHVAAFAMTEWVGVYDVAAEPSDATAPDTPAPAAAGGAAFFEPSALAAEAAEPPAAKADTEADDESTTPAARVPLTPEQHARRAEHYAAHTGALLRTLRVLGILFSVLLWITLFLYLQIALLGRLAGIRQLTNAVFVLLLFLATAVPWENIFPDVHIGAFYDFKDLLLTHAGRLQGTEVGIWGHWAGYYLKFLAMPLLSLVLLVLAYANFSSGYNDSVVVNE